MLWVIAGTISAMVATVLSLLRWIRVAQREHYVAGSVTTTALLWLTRRPINAVLLVAVVVLAAAGALSGLWYTVAAMATLCLWPLGLSIQGRTSNLSWTGRARRLGAATFLISVGLIGLATWLVPWAVALVPVAAPLIADACLAVLGPVERSLGKKYVVRARKKLGEVAPRVVAITGSYGKTSTKAYVGHLLARREAVLVSPASFNNLMGLSKTINDQLVPGTSVFVAEMGTYGEGEIRELCNAFPPQVSVIVTIGEAHLARMKDRATIVRAKSEIAERSAVAVLNVDVPELAVLGDQLAPTQRVIRCSVDPSCPDADVVVFDTGECWQVWISRENRGELARPESGHPINLACALGVALGLEVEIGAADLSGILPVAPHRAEIHQADGGPTVVDDTYNSNPTGAARALAAAAARLPVGGQLYVVTPGMVELGARQAQRNTEFARLAVSEPRFRLLIVGWTNRTALLQGGREGPGEVTWFSTREDATRGLSARLRAGDVVLYENDLPDHLP